MPSPVASGFYPTARFALASFTIGQLARFRPVSPLMFSRHSLAIVAEQAEDYCTGNAAEWVLPAENFSEPVAGLPFVGIVATFFLPVNGF